MQRSEGDRRKEKVETDKEKETKKVKAEEKTKLKRPKIGARVSKTGI